MTYNYAGLDPDERTETMKMNDYANAETGNGNYGEPLTAGTHHVILTGARKWISSAGTEFMIVDFTGKSGRHSEFMTLSLKPYPMKRIGQLYQAVGAGDMEAPEPWNDVDAHFANVGNAYLGIEIGPRKDDDQKMEIKNFIALTNDQIDTLIKLMDDDIPF